MASDYYFFHGMVQTVAWVFLVIPLMASVRWLHGIFWNKTIWIHAIFGWIITLLTLVSITAIQRNKTRFFKKADYHHLIGNLFVVFIMPLALTGSIALAARYKSTWNTKQLNMYRQIHKVMGIIFIIMSIMLVSQGILIYWENWRQNENTINMATIYIHMAIVIFAIFEIWYRYRRDIGIVELTPSDLYKKYEIYSEAEYLQMIKNGMKLCILDDLILDVGKYSGNHPGGAFLIDFTVGKDISKFFYGGHALDGNSNDPKAITPKHTHSNIARAIVCDLAIGKLSKHKAVQCIGFINHSETVNLNQHTATYTFTLSKEKGLEALPIKSYHEELEFLGKHYMVGATKDSLQNSNVQVTGNTHRVRRHYTIANCMQKQFYDRLLKAAQVFLEGRNPESILTADQLSRMSTEETDQLCLTIKNYNVPNGISKQFSDSMLKKQPYEIKGPMGKGLGLTQHSKGVHMAFTAGTGVLVFVDLIARLLLSSLEIIDPSQRFQPDFQLHLYASFMSREEAIALSLIEALQKVQMQKGLNQFKLILRLSKTDMPQAVKPPRWDEKYLSSVLSNAKYYNGGVSKIWACGPPLMDEQFDKILSKLSLKFDIDFKSQVDIM